MNGHPRGTSEHESETSGSSLLRNFRRLAAPTEWYQVSSEASEPRQKPLPTLVVSQLLSGGAEAVDRPDVPGGDLFEALCHRVQGRNKAWIFYKITPYIVPSAEHLAVMGNTKLKCLIENVKEAWTNSIPIEGPRPQPDYSVGFNRSAFTDAQLKRLRPIIGTPFDTSYFVATCKMYLPFFACEVTSGSAALDIADLQNAHNMAVAVRGVIELYRAVGREKELSQEILAFSISHDHRNVLIYGHYPVIDGAKVTCHRHMLREYNIVDRDGRDKWTAYKFVTSVYDVWMPTHLKRLTSAIDQLPDKVDFDVSAWSEAAPGAIRSICERCSLSFGNDHELSYTGSQYTGSQPATLNISVSREEGHSGVKSEERDTAE